MAVEFTGRQSGVFPVMYFSIHVGLRAIFFGVGLAILGASSVSRAAEGANENLQQQIAGLWDENQAAMQKCHLRYRLISRPPNGQVAKQDVDQLMAKLPQH